MLIYLSYIDGLSFSPHKTYNLGKSGWLAERYSGSGVLISFHNPFNIINLRLKNVAVESEAVSWFLRAVCLVYYSTEAIGTDHLVGVIKSKDISDILDRLSILIFTHV